MSQKNVNKFLAGAVTATMVATAVVTPAMAASFTDIDKLSPQVKGEVEKAVELGYFQNADKFNPAASITRGQVALTIARHVSGVGANDVAGLKAYVAEHGLEDKVKGFVDVKKGETELYYASLIVKNAGAFTQDSLNAANNITRSQMAKVIATSFELTLDADNQKEITDIDRVTDKSFIEILASNGVTEPQNGKFNPGANVTRSQMASFLVRAHEVSTKEVPASVTGAKAVNGKTVELTGKGLNNLKAEDVTVEGIKVVSVVADKDGKTATVKLETALNPGKEYKVSVKEKEATKEFTVKYTFDVESVAITTTTVDEDTANQQLAIAVNGTAIDLDTLVNTNGWEVEFQADKEVFLNDEKTSTSGILDVEKLQINDTFNVKVVIKKEGVVVESKDAKISVVSNVTPSLEKVALKNDATGIMNSSTLVVGETATVSGVFSKTGDVINISGLKDYSSSDLKVASVDKDGKITPLAPGKATITIKAGKEVFTKEITVVNEARVATTAKADHEKVALANVAGTKKVVNFVVLDQYGDKVANDELLNKLEVKTFDNTAASISTGNTQNKVTVEVATGAKNGNYTVYLRNIDTDKNLGQFTVNLSNENTIDSYKIVGKTKALIDGDQNKEPKLTFTVEAYNKAGGFLNEVTEDVTLESADTKVATVDGFTVTGVKEGSTDIVLKKDGKQVAKTTVTFVNETVKVTAIDWKSTGQTITNKDVKITYADALNLTKVANADDIVNGVKLSKETTSKVRYNTNNNTLYLDVNDDGKKDSKDILLGNLKVVKSTGNITAGSLENILETKVNDEGTLTFTFTDTVSVPSKVVTSSILNVNVKEK